MYSLREFIGRELTGWKKQEVFWLLFACAVICGVSIYWGDTAVGIISAVSGVACVVLTGKGKLSAYLFGTVNVILYALIAFQATYYGDTVLNLAFYLPMQFIGFFMWSRHMNRDTCEVVKRRMSGKLRIVLLGSIALATAGCGFLLMLAGDALPFIDSFTTVASVAAMIVSVRMFAEQWWIWIAVDVFSIVMWTVNFLAGNTDVATLLMWVVYLINAVIMWRRWSREAVKNGI